jgi:replicative DNA helicase
VVDRIGAAQAKLELLQEVTSKSEPEPVSNFVVSVLDRIQALADGEIEPGIPTGIADLDRLLSGGLRGGKQIIIAARPSVGKSSLSEQLCLNLATRGIPAAMFSQEMTKDELTDRAVCNLGRIDLGRYLTGKLQDDEWSRLSDAVEMIRDLPFYLDDQPQLTLQTISAKARMLKRKHGIKLLVLDYIQLCGTTNPKASRHHQLEELSRGLKSLAKLLDISIVTLSQLNREVEKRPGGRPIMADLKESGAIEEDADIVGLMWKHSVGEEHNVVGLELAKNRQGRTGQLALHFQGSMQRWGQSTESLDRKPEKSGAGRDL